MEKRTPQTWFIDLDEKDDKVCFFSREVGEGDYRIVIIPKTRFELSETKGAYILTELPLK